jgi:Zn-dependent M16 (insulinase) family peptidase
MKILETWLYDEDPFVHFDYQTLFETLKTKASDGYFEELIQRCFLDNPHKVYLTLKPNKEFNAKKEEAIRMELKTYEDSLNEEQRQALYDYTH